VIVRPQFDANFLIHALLIDFYFLRRSKCIENLSNTFFGRLSISFRNTRRKK